MSIPWTDLTLFLIIGGLLFFWWTRMPDAAAPGASAQNVGGAQAASPLTSDVAGSPPSPTLAVPSSTPTPLPTATLTPTAVPTPIRYEVVAGDTLELIAGRFEIGLKDLMEANGLSATDLLRIGAELLIPTAGFTRGPTPVPTPTGGTLVYSVQPGDSIQSIAMRFNSQVAWILDANKLQATDLLQISQSLLIPLTAATPKPTMTPTRTPHPVQTAGLPLRKPALLSPADGELVSGCEDVLLTWASVALLAEDQWYVVTLRFDNALITIAPYWTKGTSWRLPDDLRQTERESTDFTWQVQVFSGSPSAPGADLSEPSDERTFTWL